MNRLTLPAPAKLNLFLHILGRRADGYHRLQTLFQLLDFGDQLTLEATEAPAIELTCNQPALTNDDNLVVRAARALQAASGSSLGARIHLEKRLPAGGGIGGGSSDAASTLLALNQLWECGLSLGQLAALATPLGADVPVFIWGRTAWAEGIGEELQPLEMPEKVYLVLTPPVSVATGAIFAHPELTRDTPAITVAAFFEQATGNDCQAVVTALYPEVGDCLSWLAGHPGNTSAKAQMTGTGASVFAAFDSQKAAQAVLTDSPWPGFVARGVNYSIAHRHLSTDR